MFKISVEYYDGRVKDYNVDKKLWHDVVLPALEADENVQHYTVDEIEENKGFGIENFWFEYYHNAIKNVIKEINTIMGTDFSYCRDKNQIDMLAESLGIKFDADGNILK